MEALTTCRFRVTPKSHPLVRCGYVYLPRLLRHIRFYLLVSELLLCLSPPQTKKNIYTDIYTHFPGFTQQPRYSSVFFVPKLEAGPPLSG